MTSSTLVAAAPPPEPEKPTPPRRLRLRELADSMQWALRLQTGANLPTRIVEHALRWSTETLAVVRTVHREFDFDLALRYLRHDLAERALETGVSLVGPLRVEYAVGPYGLYPDSPPPEWLWTTTRPAAREGAATFDVVHVRLSSPTRPLLTEE